VRLVPDERLLIETDCPDQTPVPHRPAPNEPAFLVAIAAEVARIRGQFPSDLYRITEENARRLFHLRTLPAHP
jgi:TatD DNase family protein